ncbi:MAG: NAD(+) diphosphatase [Gammaproteobacteria bacterium]|nr:NAD(+) diphosphatase [Gammaproteobacteria bacterium]
MWKFNFHGLDRDALIRSNSKELKQLKYSDQKFLLIFNEKLQVLMATDGYHPINGHMQADVPSAHHWIYLGKTNIDNKKNATPWFCTKVESNQFELSFHQQWIDLRLVLAQITEPYASTMAYGKALLHWHREHAFCGRCGHSNFFHMAGHERYCESCERSIFPRTDPAIIVSVTYQDRLLLARQSSWPDKRYSVLAGFVEPGESFEQAVVREVKEESNLNVHKCEYIGSQPWPFPCSIMIGFNAEAKNTNFELLDDELEKALWVTPKELEQQVKSKQLKLPTEGSISFALIERWARSHSLNLDKLLTHD